MRRWRRRFAVLCHFLAASPRDLNRNKNIHHPPRRMLVHSPIPGSIATGFSHTCRNTVVRHAIDYVKDFLTNSSIRLVARLPKPHQDHANERFIFLRNVVR